MLSMRTMLHVLHMWRLVSEEVKEEVVKIDAQALFGILDPPEIMLPLYWCMY